MKNATLVAIFIVLLGIDLFLGYNLISSISPSSLEKNNSPENSKEISPQKVVPEKKNTLPQKREESSLKIILVGDIMLDRGVKEKIEKNGNGDCRFPFLKIASYFQKADVVFGNLEGPITSDGVKSGSKYSFRDDPQCIEGLKFANFNVLSLSNNHILDYGRRGLTDTIDILKKNNIVYVGAGLNLEDAFSLKIKEIKGVKVGFLSFTAFGSKYWWPKKDYPGVAFLPEKNFPYVKNEIQEAKKKVDILIVYLHAGQEYSSEPNEFQKKFSKMAIEAGADIVVGSHPHVVQRGEYYQDGFIEYSLGNFIFDQFFSKETMEGKVLEVNLEGKKIKDIIERKFKINQFYQPYFESLTFER